MLKSVLSSITVALFSALLIAYAYDIAADKEIAESGSRQGVQEMVVFASRLLGVTGSWILGILATTGSLYYTVSKYRNEKRR